MCQYFASLVVAFLLAYLAPVRLELHRAASARIDAGGCLTPPQHLKRKWRSRTSKSTRSGLPAKPHPNFSLFPHATGRRFEKEGPPPTSPLRENSQRRKQPPLNADLNRETICWQGASGLKIPLANRSMGGEPAQASQGLRPAEDGLNLHMVFRLRDRGRTTLAL